MFDAFDEDKALSIASKWVPRILAAFDYGPGQQEMLTDAILEAIRKVNVAQRDAAEALRSAQSAERIVRAIAHKLDVPVIEATVRRVK